MTNPRDQGSSVPGAVGACWLALLAAACAAPAPTASAPAPMPTLAGGVTATPVESSGAPTDRPLSPARTVVGRPSATSTAVESRRSAASFAADASSLPHGACTILRWRLPVARGATLDDEPVAPVGERNVCPAETTVYRLRWRGPDGRFSTSMVTVTVQVPPLTIGIAPPTFEDRDEDRGRPTESGAPGATPTGCTPCAGSTRPPTRTRPPEPTDALEPTFTPEPPTPGAETSGPPTADPTAPPTP